MNLHQSDCNVQSTVYENKKVITETEQPNEDNRCTTESSHEEVILSETYSKRKKKVRILESDDSGEETETKNGNQLSLKENEVSVKLHIEKDELENTFHASDDKRVSSANSTKNSDDSDNDTQEIINENSLQTIYVTNNKGELVPESEGLFEATKKKLDSLCDADSSDEEISIDNANNSRSSQSSRRQNKSVKKSQPNKSKKEPKPKKMTGREAAKQREEIIADSQKRLRESNISLPYHKPKSRTLKEFLENRPKLASAIPIMNTAPSVAIKLASGKLEEIAKKLEERERVVEEFYKSDTESEDDKMDDKNEQIKISESQNAFIEEENHSVTESKIDTTDKTLQNCNENSHSLQEIINKDGHALREEYASAVVENHCPNFSVQDVETCKNIQIQNTEIINADVQSADLNRENSEDECALEKRVVQNLETKNYNDNKNNTNDNNCATNNYEDNNELHSSHKNDNQYEKNTDHKVASDMCKEEEELNTEDKNGPSFEQNDNDSHLSKFQCLAIRESNFEKNALDTEDTNTFDYDFNLDDIENTTEENTINEQNSVNDMQSDFTVCKDIIIENTDNIGAQDAAVNAENKLKSNEANIYFTEKEEMQINNLIEKFGAFDKDNEIKRNEKENEVITRRLSKLEILKEKMTNFKPKLSGMPDQAIDLEDVPTPTGIAKLRERFLQHTSKKNNTKNKVQLNVISVTGGEIHKETVAMSVEPEDEPIVLLEKPGAKFQKLKNELQNQIVQRKTEMWQTKQNKARELQQNKDDKESDSAMDPDILDDEEEVELTESSEEELDEEEEGDDFDYRDKPKKKSEFINSEAEESDLDEDERCKEKEEVEDENEVKGDFDENENDSVGESGCSNDNVSAEKSNIKKPHKRIITGFLDDSDDDCTQTNSNCEKNPINPTSQDQSPKSNSENKSTSKTSSVELDSTQSCEDDDDILPPYQPRTNKTPLHQATQSKDDFDFLTPVTYLTGLQSFSASKFLKEPIINSPFPLMNSSPEKDIDTSQESQTAQIGAQRKLKFDGIESNESQLSSGISNTQIDMEQIAELCSGNFSSQLPSSSTQLDVQKQESGFPTTQDFLNVCSGKFDGLLEVSQKEEFCSESIPKKANEKIINTASSFAEIQKGNLNNDQANIQNSKEEKLTVDKSMEMKNLGINDYDEKIISQLLDEEEIENFKKKFASPIISSQFEQSNREPLSLNEDVDKTDVLLKGGRLVLDSSEEEDEINSSVRKKKKLSKKKITFSDDESSDSEEEQFQDEEIDLQDEIEDEESQVNNAEVDYDSEENEVEVDEGTKKETLKPSDFLEEEAELSESEWGSADENEDDLDTFEIEEGDQEKFDEEQVQRDLEKIHMRQVLDEDNRQVRILQELLLEDGELHGSGRQRQFRWRNIDSINNDPENNENEENDVYLDNEESEEHWRRMRHQREMFLKKKMEKGNITEEDEVLSLNSQVLQLGQKALQRSISNSQGETQANKEKQTPSVNEEVEQPFSLFNKRGSFLSRTDKILTRIAEMTKVEKSGMKHSKAFIFQKIDEVSIISDNATCQMSLNKKRKIQGSTPLALKKIRLSSNICSETQNETITCGSSRQKLFD